MPLAPNSTTWGTSTTYLPQPLAKHTQLTVTAITSISFKTSPNANISLCVSKPAGKRCDSSDPPSSTALSGCPWVFQLGQDHHSCLLASGSEGGQCGQEGDKQKVASPVLIQLGKNTSQSLHLRIETS